MAYVQKNNPFPITSCGRRFPVKIEQDTPLQCWKGYKRVPGTKEFSDNSCVKDSPAQMRKTTKGSGRTFRTTEEGAGMTSKGVAQYKKENPGSNLKTAVTGDVKSGSRAAARRKSFCARSRGWTGERGKAARARWKC
jgi:hypothetical protein